MRLPATTRLLALTVAAWFACASCAAGCDMALLPAPTNAEAHHHGLPAENESDAHNCCEEPEGNDPAEQPTPAGVKECCSKVTTGAVEKLKRPKMEPATDHVMASASSELRGQPNLLTGPAIADCGGTYLRYRVLRI